jgi:PKD repeat protein
MSINIAINKAVSQSTTYGDMVAAKGVDNNMDTQQATNNVANDWFKIDLGYFCTIESVVLYKASTDRPSNYKIQTADNYEFTINVIDRYTGTSETELTHTIVFDPVLTDIRYIRIYCTGTQFINCKEIQVWGTEEPHALFSGTPLVGNGPPLSVTFTDESVGALSWDWDFGDGSPHSTLQNPTHIYTAKGVWSVTLSINGGGGVLTNKKTRYVNAFCNIALNKTCSQSTTYSDFIASNAVDDNMTTRAATASSPNDWWKVDFGSIQSIYEIVLNKYLSDRPSNYKIQIADDYAFVLNVVDAVIEVAETSTTKTIVFLPYLTTRYLRIYCTGTQFIDSKEVQVYGTDWSPIPHPMPGRS